MTVGRRERPRGAATRRLTVAVVGVIAFVTGCMAREADTTAAALPTAGSAIAAARSATDYFYANNGGATSDASWRWAPFFMGVEELGRATGDPTYRDWLQRWGDRNHWDPTEPASPTSNPDGRAAIQVWERSSSQGVLADLGPSNAAMASDLGLAPSQYWWIDALFMGLPLWTTWTTRTGDPRYRAKGAEFYQFLKTQGATTWRDGCSNTGLFDPTENLWWRDCMYVSRRDAQGHKVFWSRGNGWVLAAMARTLAGMPPSDPQYAGYAEMLQKMAARIAALQPADGVWRTSLLSPAVYPVPETSGTALFAYAMAYGIRTGLLDRAVFGPVVQRAWDGLLTTALKPSGFLSNCQGVGEAPGTPSTTTSIAYCVGAFTLAATELAKLDGAAATTVAQDNFSRTVPTGWGSADIGGAWSGITTPANYSVAGGSGRISMRPGDTRAAYLAGVSLPSTNVRVSAAFPRPAIGSVYVSVIGRRVGAAEYAARAVVAPDGSVRLQLQRQGSTIVQATVPGVTLATDDRLTLQLETLGSAPTTLRARTWKVGTAEPEYLLTTTDATAGLQGSGSVGLVTYYSANGAPNPLVVSFDDFVASTGAGAPGNLPPVASFSSGSTGTTVAVDGSTSSDPDGSIASYDWSFGDGAVAAGRQATHAYGAAGTYPVTLAVTDDRGARSSTSRDVTVAAAPPTTLAADSFARTVTGGWGTAPAGGGWTVAGGAPADYRVDGGAGRITTPAGHTRTASLGAVSSVATDLTASVAFVRPAGGTVYVGLAARRVGAEEYAARVLVAPSGGVQLQIRRSSTTILSQPIGALTYTTGDALRIRVRATGASPTQLQARVWKVGTAEPASWQVSANDSAVAALQAPGGVGVSSYFSVGGSPSITTVAFDDLAAVVPG